MQLLQIDNQCVNCRNLTEKYARLFKKNFWGSVYVKGEPG